MTNDNGDWMWLVSHVNCDLMWLVLHITEVGCNLVSCVKIFASHAAIAICLISNCLPCSLLYSLYLVAACNRCDL